MSLTEQTTRHEGRLLVLRRFYVNYSKTLLFRSHNYGSRQGGDGRDDDCKCANNWSRNCSCDKRHADKERPLLCGRMTMENQIVNRNSDKEA